ERCAIYSACRCEVRETVPMITKTWPRALAWRAQLFRRGFALKPRSRCRFRPLVEILEDRVVLSTITVIGAGDGVGTLTPVGTDWTSTTLFSAIEQANSLAGADTINFNFAGGNTITLFGALPFITDQVTIDGTNLGTGGHVEIDGNGVFA